MDIRQLEPNVVLIPLLPEPQLRQGLALVRKHLGKVQGKHLVLDFTHVEIITSVSIGDLLLLQKAVTEWGGRLIFCGVRLITRCILRTVGLDLCFEVVEDASKALKTLHEAREVSVDAPRDSH